MWKKKKKDLAAVIGNMLSKERVKTQGPFMRWLNRAWQARLRPIITPPPGDSALLGREGGRAGRSRAIQTLWEYEGSESPRG